MKTFIVEDEIPARNELRRFLQNEKDFEVVGEAADGDEALNEINRLSPALVFLDIHIPKRNGLEVAAALAGFETPPLVVFVTAYDQYAIQAFELNALDYLLKPYDEARFKKTCEKIRRTLRNRPQFKEKLISLRDYLEKGKPPKIVGRRRNSRDRAFIHLDEVLYFHVQLTETAASLTSGEKLLVNATLRSLLDMLDPARFQQTHRAYIVNLDQVEKIAPLFSGNFKLVLKDPAKTTIPLSRRYSQKLKRFLKW